MVLLKALIVVSGLAYGASLNLDTDVNARNVQSQVMERTISAGHSVFLELSIFYSPEHKKHLVNKTSVDKYLTKFVEKINHILHTGKQILQVTFTLVDTILWKEAHRALLTPGKKDLDAELLKAILKVFGSRHEKEWKKHHPRKNIDAVLFLTPQPIKNVEKNRAEIGIAGQIGGICLPAHFVAAAQDKPGSYDGVRSAARQLSTLMGSVYDGEKPPSRDLVPGSDGADWCKYEQGYLMGNPQKWQKHVEFVQLSTCTASQYIMGLRHRGPGCYSYSSSGNTESNAIPQ